MKNIQRKYYFRLLSAREQAVYREIYGSLAALKPEVKLPAEWPLAPQRYVELLQFVLLDHPIFFFLDKQHIQLLSQDNGRTPVALNLKFIYSEKRIREMLHEMQRQSEAILANLRTNRMTELEKEYAIHDFLRDRVAYQLKAADAHNIAGILLHGKGVCDGIAKTCKLLCDEVGVECIVVNIGGRYQHLDVTWNNTLSASTGFRRYDYFNLSDTSIAVDHQWERRLLPSCPREPDNHFARNEWVAESPFEVRKLIGAQLHGGAKHHALRFRARGTTGHQAERLVLKCVEELYSGKSFSYSTNERLNMIYYRLL